jgi:hypothetical protein
VMESEFHSGITAVRCTYNQKKLTDGENRRNRHGHPASVLGSWNQPAASPVGMA